MDLYDVMRTTFAARSYTTDRIEDDVLYRILDNARFAPSGGNRQGWRVIVVKDEKRRLALKKMMQPTVQQYVAQARAGEVPFNTITPSQLDGREISKARADFPLIDELVTVPVLLVVCVDLSQVTSFDADLDRVGVISGASIYPFIWNILLSARNEGFGGVLTTFLANSEPAAQQLLGLPEEFAICSMVALGKPTRQLHRLSRLPVEDFTRVDDWNGPVLTA